MNYEQVFCNDYACDRTVEVKTTFNVVIVYDDRNAANRAMSVFRGLVRQFSDEFEFHCHLWRFDLLDLPEAREAAIRTGAASDLLIVSAWCDIDLPASVKDWIERSVAGKAPGSAALAALLESRCRSSDVQHRTREFLKSAADRRLMDFFLHEVDLPQSNLDLTAEVLAERANAGSSVLEGILQRGEAPLRSCA